MFHCLRASFLLLSQAFQNQTHGSAFQANVFQFVCNFVLEVPHPQGCMDKNYCGKTRFKFKLKFTDIQVLIWQQQQKILKQILLKFTDTFMSS